AQQERLVLDEVLHGDDALRDLRQRLAAGVLHEPSGAADGCRAVLAARAERARAVAPQLARLRLLDGRRGLARSAGSELLDELELRDPPGLGDLEDAAVEQRALGRLPGLGDGVQPDLAVTRVDDRAERDALRRVDRLERRAAGLLDERLAAHRRDHHGLLR